ncbi:MAG: hypothetical protein PVI06_19670 [Desulfobacterales bacterium]
MAQENDVVLIYFEDKPLSFARIENILPDAKPDWYHVRLLLLQDPLQVVTWILKDVYINGETFTMNGKKMRLEPVVAPAIKDAPEPPPHKEKPSGEPGKARVLSFVDRKKPKPP